MPARSCHTHITAYISSLTFDISRDITRRGTDRALWHTIVSHPTATISTSITEYFVHGAVRRWRGVTLHGGLSRGTGGHEE